MTEANENKVPIWFWIISATALLWNFGGVMAFIGQVTMAPEDMEKLSEAQRAAMAGLPSWMTIVFAVAVFAGALGCLLLLLRKKLAVWVFALSLLAVLCQQCYWWFLSDVGKNLEGFDLIMTLAIPIVALFLIWFSRTSAAKNWLN